MCRCLSTELQTVRTARRNNEPTFIVRNFSVPLSEMDRSSRQNISKDRVELYSTINQLDINDIYRLLHPMTTEYTFFSSSYGILTLKVHILGHTTHLNKFRRMAIIQCLLSNEIKRVIDNRKMTEKSQNTWRLNNTLRNNTWVKEEISRN